MACIPKYLAEAFLEKLKAGEITPQKLIDLKSEGRRKFFTEFMGEENAKNVNALFESKLLLKNQMRGIVEWAKKEAGLKPEVRRDILSRVNRMTEVLNPKTEDAFLSDLAAQRLGVNVSMKEAINISQLAKAVAEAESKVPEGSPDGSPERMVQGYAMREFRNYVDKLKKESADTSLIEKLKNPLKIAEDAAGVAKGMNASLDKSAIFRQGWNAIGTNPVLWAKNAIKSIGTTIEQFGGKDVKAYSEAKIMSSKYYDKAVKAKLAVSTIEEEIPSNLPEKIPLFGKLYKATQDDFEIFIHGLRMDIFSKYVEHFEKMGIDTSNKETLQSLGKVVNSLTGRGDLGKAEPIAGLINNVFFSGRAVKGQFDVLTSHLADPNMTIEAKKLAATNLIKIVGLQASILILAEILQPGSTEKDFRSADSGKIKVGSTRFDVSGGKSSLMTLAARLITGESKSSTTGKVRKVDPVEAISAFLENKLSPAATASLALARHEDRDGRPVNVTSMEGMLNLLDLLFTPIGVKNLRDDQKVYDHANSAATFFADFFGIGTNSYSQNKSK